MFSVDGGSLLARKKKEKKAAVSEDGAAGSGDAAASSSVTSAQLRIAKDMADLEIPSNVELRKEDDYNLSFIISPDTGYWKGGQFEFKFQFPSKYPFQGPKVTCVDQIYHPNIDLEGAPCVNVLRPWKPTYSTQIVLFGLLFLFTHPNPGDPLNQEAAKEMREQPAQFAKNVVNALKGMKVGATQFPKNKGKGPFAQV